jgi:hypothetical protein
MNCKPAEEFIKALRPSDTNPYIEYWATLVPHTARERWLRWVFAFTSVHVSWSSNVKGYNAVAALSEDFTKPQLTFAIVSSGVGLHSMRIQGIWDFTKAFRNDPDWFSPQAGESMVHCRDRLAKHLFGIGMAKTSFVFELVYPITCGVVCLDTHILRLYGCRGSSPKPSVYHEIEAHWRKTCYAQGVPLAMARHIYWDRLQGKDLNRYWAWCLERQVSSAERKGGQRDARDVRVPLEVGAA